MRKFWHNKKQNRSDISGSILLDIKNLNLNNLPILQAQQIIDLLSLQTRINSIESIVGTGDEYFKLLYKPALYQYIESVQLAPASVSHHHAGPGGLVTHTLEVIDIALRLRKSYNLPLQAITEVIIEQEHVWTYAVFAGALLHDIGKMICNTQIELNTGKSWTPHDASILKTGATHYKISFKKSHYKLHTQLSNGFLHILPTASRGWLSHYQDVLAQLTAWLAGDIYEYGSIGEIVRAADGESVANNLKIGGDRNRFPNSPTVPMVDKLTTALRQMLEKGLLKINGADGSSGWCDNKYTYLVCRTVADQVRQYLNNAGANDIPTDNSRLFDTWQEHGFIDSTTNGGAIWYLTINKKLTLSVLKFETNVIFHPCHRPDAFTGDLEVTETKPISIVSDKKCNLNDKKNDPQFNENISNVSSISVEPINNGIVEYAALDRSTDPNSKINQTDAIQITAGKTPIKDIDDIGCNKGDKNKASAPTMPAPIVCSPAPDTFTLDDPNIANYFLDWIRRGVRDGKIFVNRRDALLHIVKEGIFIVSPLAFKEFARKHKLMDSKNNEDDATKRVQNKLEKLMKKTKLHKKTRNGLNIHTYLIQGPNRESKIRGWLVPVETIYGEIKSPDINKPLINITGFLGENKDKGK